MSGVIVQYWKMICVQLMTDYMSQRAYRGRGPFYFPVPCQLVQTESKKMFLFSCEGFPPSRLTVYCPLHSKNNRRLRGMLAAISPYSGVTVAAQIQTEPPSPYSGFTVAPLSLLRSKPSRPLPRSALPPPAARPPSAAASRPLRRPQKRPRQAGIPPYWAPSASTTRWRARRPTTRNGPTWCG